MNFPSARGMGNSHLEKCLEGWSGLELTDTLFSNNDIFLGRYAFIRSDVGRKDVLPQLNASIRLRQSLNKILHTVLYTKDLWHTTRDFTVKYTDQPKIPPVLVPNFGLY